MIKHGRLSVLPSSLAKFYQCVCVIAYEDLARWLYWILGS